MKEKMIVRYVKSGKEVEVALNFFNKRKVIKDIFVNPFYNLDSYDYYQLDDEVTHVCFKNVTFYHDVKFVCPKDTHLILENCTFHGNMIHFIEGNVRLVGPQMPQEYYSNCIFGSKMENFVFYMDDQNSNYLSLSVDGKAIFVYGSQRLANLSLRGDTIKLQNIYGLRNFFADCNYLRVQYSDINIPSIISESSMPEIKVGKTLSLVKSCLGSYDTLKIDCDSIFLDPDSYLYSYHHLQIGDSVYENLHMKDHPLYLYQNDLKKTEEEGIKRVLKKDSK